MKYFGNRQDVLKEFTVEEKELAFQTIVEHFNIKWLISLKFHPLQKLWNRKDVLSTNELFSFGTYLHNLNSLNAKWVKEQVKHIKSDHRNNQQGAFFEICALGMLINAKQKIEPAKGNNPGYDGILTVEPEKTMRISIKNYGLSAAHLEFNSYSYQFEQNLIAVLKEKRISKIQLLIDSFKKFPTKDDWKILNDGLPDILQNFTGDLKLMGIPEKWGIILTGLHDTKDSFHEDFNSYTLLLSSVYKQNEEKNLFDKLDEACYNLTKHSPENDNIINSAFIHLPETASIISCKDWVNSYFKQYPEKPLTCVILYQPTIATDLDTDQNFINHCFQIIVRDDKFSRWNVNAHNINFTPLVGKVSMDPAINIMTFEDNEGKRTIDLNTRYLYQKGNHYVQQEEHPDGTITGNVYKLASGVFAHSVMQPFKDQRAFVLSGHFPPDDKLLIL
ncbi:hypothetical protein CAP35_07600 [Chitinophagaceae bacterium IBVUCB1]|nr:hypothetical protein CAP35_07600 [Chitinophagaceae bacterium IBVUCB1]